MRVRRYAPCSPSPSSRSPEDSTACPSREAAAAMEATGAAAAAAVDGDRGRKRREAGEDPRPRWAAAACRPISTCRRYWPSRCAQKSGPAVSRVRRTPKLSQLSYEATRLLLEPKSLSLCHRRSDRGIFVVRIHFVFFVEGNLSFGTTYRYLALKEKETSC